MKNAWFSPKTTSKDLTLSLVGCAEKHVPGWIKTLSYTWAVSEPRCAKSSQPGRALLPRRAYNHAPAGEKTLVGLYPHPRAAARDPHRAFSDLIWPVCVGGVWAALRWAPALQHPQPWGIAAAANPRARAGLAPARQRVRSCDFQGGCYPVIPGNGRLHLEHTTLICLQAFCRCDRCCH